MVRCCVFALCAIAALCLCGCVEEKVGEDEPEMRRIFAEARRLDNEGKHHEALIKYELILAKHPEWMSTRFNAAMAGYDAGEFDKAANHFEILHKFGPTDWFVIRKLIQCYERLEKKDKVEKFRQMLTDLRNRQDGSPLLKQYQGFTRDYIPIGTLHLIGYEFFDPHKHGKLWFFKLEDQHRKPLSSFMVESSPFHDNDGHRLFYITESCPGWMRVWYVGPEGKDYDWSRKTIVDILSGKCQPLCVKPLPADVEIFDVPGGGPDAPPTPENGAPPPKNGKKPEAEKPTRAEDTE